MNNLNNTPFPILITNRLVLRKLDKSDDQAIFELRSNNSVNQFIGRKIATSIVEAQAFIENIMKNESFYWAITLKDNTHVIGTICLWNFSDDKTSAEIGYELNPTYQGLGIMQEAITAIISYTFNTIKIKELDAYTHKENMNSSKLLIKNGFVLNDNKVDAENENIIVYSLKYPNQD